jgi:hypothetical protein|tara:strand:+ start:36 stop:161 length:126 start_codon:yes stop_codon:yes gene_type:complete
LLLEAVVVDQELQVVEAAVAVELEDLFQNQFFQFVEIQLTL